MVDQERTEKKEPPVFQANVAHVVVLENKVQQVHKVLWDSKVQQV